jgi:hypothetical protein
MKAEKNPRSRPPADPAIPPETALIEMLSLGVILSPSHLWRMIPLDAENAVPRVNHWTPVARANMTGVEERKTPENAPTRVPDIPRGSISHLSLSRTIIT